MNHSEEFANSALSPRTEHEFRVPAIAGVIAVVCFDAAYAIFSKIGDALNITALDHGMAELASHSTLALVCQQLFAVADIAMIVFLFGLAALARPRFRGLAWLGSFLFSISFALDLLVAASIVSVTILFAPHAAQDAALRAAGTATLGFASVLDFRESFLWMAGSILLGASAWSGQHWPKWLAGVAILNGLLSAPYLPFFLSVVLGTIVFTIWVLGMSVVLWQRKAR